MKSRKSSVAEQSFTQEIYEDYNFGTKKHTKNELCASSMIFWGEKFTFIFHNGLCRLRPLYLLSVKEPTTKINILNI